MGHIHLNSGALQRDGLKKLDIEASHYRGETIVAPLGLP